MKQLKYLAFLAGLALVGFLLYNGYVIDGFDFFGIQIRKPNTEQPAPNPNNLPVQPENNNNQPPPPQYTTINLSYAGDMYGCVLSLDIRIGNKAFRPQGNFFQVDGVERGLQAYTVTGQISCPGAGTCQAQGNSSINVVPNNTYNVVWQNVAVGQCSVVLSDQ